MRRISLLLFVIVFVFSLSGSLKEKPAYELFDHDGNEIKFSEMMSQLADADVIFFGEAIPSLAMARSSQLASTCQALLIIGTSAVVSPFNILPRQAKQVGATIIEINLEKTVLTDGITDIFLQGKATERVSQVVSAVKALQGA